MSQRLVQMSSEEACDPVATSNDVNKDSRRRIKSFD